MPPRKPLTAAQQRQLLHVWAADFREIRLLLLRLTVTPLGVTVVLLNRWWVAKGHGPGWRQGWCWGRGPAEEAP